MPGCACRVTLQSAFHVLCALHPALCSHVLRPEWTGGVWQTRFVRSLVPPLGALCRCLLSREVRAAHRLSILPYRSEDTNRVLYSACPCPHGNHGNQVPYTPETNPDGAHITPGFPAVAGAIIAPDTQLYEEFDERSWVRWFDKHLRPSDEEMDGVMATLRSFKLPSQNPG